MIISRVPFRLSLFGGGTDFPDWYKMNGGQVLGGSIDKYCYISARWLPPFFGHSHRIVYSQIETPTGVDGIQHPIVRAVLQSYEIEKGLEIQYGADLPGRSGVGSSAAFTVGLLAAVRGLLSLEIDPWAIAAEATRLEREVVGEVTGDQDQILCSLGGFQHLKFSSEGAQARTSGSLVRSAHQFSKWLFLAFTGVQRSSSKVQSAINFDEPHTQTALQETQRIVGLAKEIMQGGEASEEMSLALAELLGEAWQMKKNLNPYAETPRVRSLYERGILSGAIAGKVVGAGGGGFLLFVVPPDRQAHFVKCLRPGSIVIPLSFSSSGVEIIYSSNRLCDLEWAEIRDAGKRR